jgi:hypothetical protein
MDNITILGINIKAVVIILMIIILILIIALIITNHKINVMNDKYRALMSGKKGADLEKIIRIRFKEMDKIKANAKRVTKEHKELKKNVSHSLSRYGLVKYDAFNDVSGKLSFAVALLDENGNGLVINSMHSRKSCYTYAKEIIDGKSFVPLSEEEEQAITQAQTIDDEIDALTALAEAEDYMNYTDEVNPAYVEENAAYFENLIPPED